MNGCTFGIHQWRVDHYTTIVNDRIRMIRVVSCARCRLVRSKEHM